jgi:MOSC domain-containing protein YiiM
MNDPQFIKRFRDAERPGFYCRVIREGTVRVGENVTLELCRVETITLIDYYRAYYETDLSAETLRRMLRSPLASRGREAMQEKLEKVLGGE